MPNHKIYTRSTCYCYYYYGGGWGKICYSQDLMETKHSGTHTHQESYIGIFTSKQTEITGRI
ncbi:hypothetical protein LEMLEM_LOCUS26699 [Lemmus lemmus]